jgi:hypothetical protein
MKQYKVKQVVLCEVHTYRVVAANDMTDALNKVAAIETATASNGDMSCDYEIVSDIEIKAVTIKEHKGE